MVKTVSGKALFLLPFVVITAVSLLKLFAGTAHALEPVNQSWLGKVAIEGTDPVAYFRESRPVKGKSQYPFQWRGAQWRFSSEENRALFAKNPEKYAPRYGGYCAWAVSQGYTAGIDPEAWSIVDGKLYLNYSRDVQKQWQADREALIKKADINWPRLLSEK